MMVSLSGFLFVCVRELRNELRELRKKIQAARGETSSPITLTKLMRLQLTWVAENKLASRFGRDIKVLMWF